MRLRITLFELVLIVIPAVAIALGLCVAALRSPDLLVLTLAQSAYLLAMVAAMCALFHRRPGVRAFGGAFLAASLGHMLLIWFANQSAYSETFPTMAAFGAIWDQAWPEPAAPTSVWNSNNMGSGMMPGGSGSSSMGSSMMGGAMPIPVTPPARPLFVAVGTWAVSLVLGVLAGVIAKGLQQPDPAVSGRDERSNR